MLNEDASQAGSMGNSAPVARADVDTLPAGSYGPATGNAITGAGTSTGSAGADSATPPAHIVNVQGAGGPTSQANGNFQANGQYGVLTMDAQGDFNYVRNPGTPDGVRDVFNYTLADASGANSSTTLTIDIGQIAAAAAGQNVINLPAGVQLSDIHVNGRDLVINMPDGTQMVIPNGAVFVPDLVIGDVQVPPTNLATLLIDSEPQPGAGQTQSSGGNFAEPVPPLDPGVPLGDLIPPTELTYHPPDFRPIGQFENQKPTVVIEPHDLAPGAVDAVDQVNEKGLPGPRVGDQATETPGSGEIADGNGTNDSDPSEHTFGQIVFTAGDGLQSLTIDGLDGNPNNVVTITAASVGTTIQGEFGILTITSVDLAHGTVGYNYVLTDNNLLGDISADHFTVVVTDSSGDTATATLTVDIIDDAPIARNDTDAVAKGSDSTDGNVLTGENTTSGSAGADTPGADNLVNNGDGVTGIHAGASGSFASVTSGGTLVHGTLGDLVIHSDGSYTYTVTQTNGTPGGSDVFTYQITDQDGDTATATLTITVPPDSIPVPVNATALVDDDGLPLGNHDHAPGDDTQSPDPDNDESTWSGTLTANFGGDGPGTFSFATGTDGSTAIIGQETVTYHLVGDVLTAEVTASPDAGRVGSDLFSVTIHADGTYSIQLLENVLQVNDGTNTENNADTTLTFTATDADGDHANGTLTISFDDDIPTAVIPPAGRDGGPPTPLVTGLVDEDDLPTGNHDSAPGDDNPIDASGDSNPLTTGAPAGSLDALFNLGADRPVSFGLSTDTSGLPDLTSNGHQVLYSVQNGVLTATADVNDDGHVDGGDTTVFTLAVNPDGSWLFTLDGHLDHPTLNGLPGDNTENNLPIDLSSIVVATDSDGDSTAAAAGAFVVVVDDDMPAQVEGSVTAHVDEDELPNGITDNDAQTTIATGSLASQVSVGADQPGTFSLDAAGLAGLPTNLTSGGEAISFAIVGGELVAYTGNDSSQNHVFTVSLDSSGNYTVTLDAPIDHLPNVPANDDNQNLTLDLSGLVQVTDSDGDSIHLDANSFLVQIEDDIPAATNTQITGTVDEDGIIGNASDGGDGNGIAGGPGDIPGTATTASGNVSALFLSGADVPLTYSLSSTFTDLLGEGLTSKGIALTYNVAFDSNTHVYTLTATAGVNTVFTFTLNANTGAYQFNLIDQLDHPTLNGLPGDNTENNLAIQLGSIIQATDADGDTVTANSGANSGLVINVNDDTPVARDDTDEITGGGSTATGNVITGADTTSGATGADSTGADAPISVVAISDASHGTVSTFVNGVLTIQGDHGTLEIHANGDYTYTRTDNVGGVSDTFTYTIQDADGDTTTATLTIGIEDHIPVLATPPAAQLDDDALAGGNAGGTGDDGPPNPGDADVASGTLVGSGGDGALTYFFSGTQTGLPSGFSIEGGSTATTMFIDQLQGGNEVRVLTITLNQATGAYTVTQNAAVMHPSLDGQPGDNTENNITNLNVSFFVQDADGDHSNTVNLNINIDDDTPTINVTKGDDSAVSLTTDDAQTIGVNTDTAQTTANFAGVFGLTFSAGADGTNTTPTLGYTLGVSSQGVLSGLSSHGSAIHLYLVGNEVIGSTSGSAPANDSDPSVVFTVTVNASGQVTLSQMQQIDHPIADDPTPTGTPFSDQTISMVDSLITLTASSSITDKDGDTATDSETVNIGANLHFTDDGPHAATSGTAVGTVTLDETRPEGTDTTGGAAPAGDASNTIDFSVNFVTGGSVNYGADGPGSVGYSLHLNGSNVNSGLYALDNTDTSTSDGDGFGQGGQIVLNQSGNTITGSFGGVNYFTISIDPSTGIVTFTELHNIWNPTAGSSAAALDEIALLHTALASDIQVVQTVTDFDGDTSTASINVGQNVFGIEDDGPRFGTVDTTLNIDNSGTHPSGTGDMQFTIGTDSPNGALSGASPAQNPDDINVSNFTVSVAGNPAQNVLLTPGAETATTASYTFAFDYDTGNGTTDHETGTLVFDKSAGTYTVTLDHPVVGFSTLETAAGQAFTGYVFNTSTVTGSQPDVAVTQILGESSPGAGDGFYVQFTGFTAGNGTHETIGDATAGTYVNGDLFSEGTSVHNSWVSATGSSNGVAGDTVNGPDGLNFNLYSSDPKGFFSGQTGNAPTASASDMFMVFDGIGSAEDMLVILKLGADTNNDGILDTFTTKAIVVSNADIYKFDSAHEAGTVAALTGTQYQGVLDAEVALGGSNNNDGLVIIESNDYNAAGEHYVIVGAEVVNAADGVTGTGINLNPTVGASGGSSSSEAITDVSNTNPLKITDIGFVTGATTDQNATISFDATIHDADGDTATTSVTVNVGTPPPAPIAPAGIQTTQVVSQTSLNTSSLIATNDNVHDRGGSAQNTVMMGAVAAAGLSALSIDPGNHLAFNDAGHEAVGMTVNQTVANVLPFDNEAAGILLPSHAQQASFVSTSDTVPGGGTTFHDMVETSHALTATSANGTQNAELLHGTSVPGQGATVSVTSMTAAAVTMPSAAQLAAAVHGTAGQPLNSVVGSQHDEVVGKVLADALHGGAGQGPNVDMLLNAVSHTAGSGGNAGLEAFASVGSGAVPFTHIPGASAFGNFHTPLMVEMVMHADAHPAAAHG